MKRSRLILSPHDYRNLCNEVLHRDGYKCRVPQCKRRNNLHTHHIIFRSHGGDDVSWNLLTLCNDCHSALHDRYLVIHSADGSDLIDANKGVKFQFINGWLPKRRVA